MSCCEIFLNLLITSKKSVSPSGHIDFLHSLYIRYLPMSGYVIKHKLLLLVLLLVVVVVVVVVVVMVVVVVVLVILVVVVTVVVVM